MHWAQYHIFFSVWLHKLWWEYIVMLLKWLEEKGQRGVPISVDVTVSEGGGGGGSGMRLWLDTWTSLSSHPVSQWFTNSRWFASENRFQHRFSYVYTRMMRQCASWKPVYGEQMSAASTQRSWSWSGWDPISWKAKKCANMIPRCALVAGNKTMLFGYLLYSSWHCWSAGLLTLWGLLWCI